MCRLMFRRLAPSIVSRWRFQMAPRTGRFRPAIVCVAAESEMVHAGAGRGAVLMWFTPCGGVVRVGTGRAHALGATATPPVGASSAPVVLLATPPERFSSALLLLANAGNFRLVVLGHGGDGGGLHLQHVVDVVRVVDRGVEVRLEGHPGDGCADGAGQDLVPARLDRDGAAAVGELG